MRKGSNSASSSTMPLIASLDLMAHNIVVNCSELATRTSFSSYIATVKNATANNFALVEQCRPEVCNALWGSGNPDISGVGVSSPLSHDMSTL